MQTATANFSVESIAELAALRAARPLWLDGHTAVTWAQFGTMVAATRRQCEQTGVRAGEVVVTPGESALATLAWFFGAAAAGAVVAPLRRDRMGEFHAWKEFLGIGWRVWEGRLVRVGEGRPGETTARLMHELRDRGHAGLILATGGTTGAPKLILHDLAALLATVPVKSGPERRTLPLMRFDHIGGLDMAWRALAGGQVLVAPPADLTPAAVAATIARQRVEVLPATPSFLNLLLLGGEWRTHDLGSLRTVPYGAEPMPAVLLARLRRALPGVNFVQRFGTSETGALPVRDTGTGLVLDDSRAGYDWRVVAGELWVKSPACALGYLAGARAQLDGFGWFGTGDVAEQLSDGSIRVLGRREELINVGGAKVLPGEVEDVLLAHPHVADCRVRAEASALLGQVVAAEVVWTGDTALDAVTVKHELQAFAALRLQRHQLPAVVRLVGTVETTRHLKKNRELRG